MANANQTKSASGPISLGASLPDETAFRQALRSAIVRPVTALLLAMLLLAGILGYLFFAAGWADHSHDVLAQISRVENLVVEMEATVRGYRITGDNTFLEPFQMASTAFVVELAALERLVGDNPRQVNGVKAAREAHTTWVEFATNVRQRVQAQLPADVAAPLRGKELMDVVRGHINGLRQHEYELLAQRLAMRGRLRAIMTGAVVLSGLIVAPVLVLSVRRAFRHIQNSYHHALKSVDGERERLQITLAKVEWLASFPERNPNPVIELRLDKGEVVYANTFADKVFPDLRVQGLRHPFLAGLEEIARPLMEGKSEVARREVALGQNSYAQTICYLPDVKRLRVYCSDITESKLVARLLDSQKQSLEMIVRGTPLGEVLSYLARVAEEQSQGKAIPSILLLDAEGRLRNGASPSLPADYLAAIDGLKPCSEIGTCSAAAATSQVVLTPDIAADPKWQTLKHLPLKLGFVAAWSQPITSRDGRVLGTFGTYFRQCREPTPFERQTVEILARTAALAIERRRVEAERERFVSLAENSSDFIGMCGPDFLPFFVNGAGLAMVGIDTLEQALRMPVKEFFFPEDQERVIGEFFPSVLAQGSGEIEIRFRHFKTGAALWMLYNVWVVNDEAGKFAGLATVSRDITDRKRIEDARARLAAIVESSDDAIISKNLDGVITSWNKGAERIFGYAAAEAIGQPITLLIPFDRLDEEPGIIERIRRGEFVDHFQTVRRRKDGTLLDVSLTVSPIVDSQGGIIGASKIARDITDSKRAEVALRASEERYRSLFESIDEGFCVIEMIFDGNQRPVDYRFIEVNPAFERQAGMQGALGKRMLEYVSEIEPHWLENYGQVALVGEPIRFANEYKSLGSWFDVYAFRVGNPESRRVAVIFTNITQRKQAEAELLRSRTELAAVNAELALRAKELDEKVENRTAELRETIQQLETFSYSIVHDMRAPLRSMRSFAGVLHENYFDGLDAAAHDYLRRIMESAARMDALITDVLSYSGVSREATDLMPVDLDRLVPEIIEQYPNLQEKAESIRVTRPLPEVSGNTALLTQVFSNLLNNALKFVSDGQKPHVRVRAESNGDHVRVWVEDNGIGVPADQRDRIFGLFQRLHRPDQYAGTGVGLAIVKCAVEKMGGKAGVESEPGAGSRFWIDLRLARETT